MSELMFTPSADGERDGPSVVRPSLGDAVQTTVLHADRKSTICSMSGLKKTQAVTTGMSCTPRALPRASRGCDVARVDTRDGGGGDHEGTR